MIVVATHAVFLDGHDIYGPAHAVVKYLIEHKQTFLFIKHDLNNCAVSVIDFFYEGKLRTTIKVPYKKTTSLFGKSWQEMKLTVAICNMIKIPITVFIGADIVNALSGIPIWLRGKVVKMIFLSADFAHARFSNMLINFLYHALDFVTMHCTHQTWSVSSRIVACRKKRLLSKKKNVHFPNAPFFNSVQRKPFSQLQTDHIVIVSALENGIDFVSIFTAFAEVLTHVPTARLHLIGSGSKLAELQSLAKNLKVASSVIFHGALDHDAMFSVLTSCGIGIALYTDSDPRHFRYFSDPMKVRDYMASGLAVLLSGNSAITEEVESNQIGFAVQPEAKDLSEKLLKILSDKQLHEKMHLNAIRQASQYDTEKRIEKYLHAYV